MNEKPIQEILVNIQQNLKAPKGQKNTFGNYSYRSCEDILEAVKPLLNGCSLIATDEMVFLGTRYYVHAKAILTNGKESIIADAYAREADVKKGMDEAQITGAASSYARKYALNGLFAIDDTKDADTMDNRVAKTQPPVTQPTQQSVKPAPVRPYYSHTTQKVVDPSKVEGKCALCGAINSHKPGCPNGAKA